MIDQQNTKHEFAKNIGHDALKVSISCPVYGIRHA